MMKRSDEEDSTVNPGMGFPTSCAAAAFMASIYNDLVAFEDEIILDVEDRLPGYSLEVQHRIRVDIDLVRAERDRLRRCLQVWEGEVDA